MLLDGGLATQLEAQGADLRSRLWSAQLLLDDPAAIVAAHEAFFAAGAQVATTASYQAPVELIGLSVRLAQQARDAFLSSELSAGSVARATTHADKSEGSAGWPGRWGRTGPRWRTARSIGVTTAGRWPSCGPGTGRGSPRWSRPESMSWPWRPSPTLVEVEALLQEVAGTGVPCWLSITAAGDRTRAGEPAYAAFALAAEVPEVVAVGVNCLDPDDVPGLLALAAEASGKPGVAYPNRGEGWDADAKTWTGPGAFDPAAAMGWVAAGARLVGGCCRVTPADIATMATALSTAR